jgi:hypothetical protein
MTLSDLNKYGPAFQTKVIHSLLERKEFLINIHDILESSFFDNQAHKWIIDNILKYYDNYHTTPTPEVLKSEYEKVTNEVLKVSIREQLREAYKITSSDSEYIESEFSAFCKNQQLKKDTLELGEDYVGRRFDAYFTKIPANEIMYHKDKVEAAMTKLPGKLIIKGFAPGKATISTIESHIQKCEDLGTKIDMVIIDYVDLLRSKKTNRERKDEIDDIYTSTKGLARELDIPVWSASQVNRQGAQDEIIEGHKAAGSYDKMMITDFCASISRRAKEKQTGVGRFHIMKNRYGMDGLTYGAYINIAIGQFDLVSESEFEDLAGSSESNTNSNQITDNFNLAEKKNLGGVYQHLMNS